MASPRKTKKFRTGADATKEMFDHQLDSLRYALNEVVKRVYRPNGLERAKKMAIKKQKKRMEKSDET